MDHRLNSSIHVNNVDSRDKMQQMTGNHLNIGSQPKYIVLTKPTTLPVTPTLNSEPQNTFSYIQTTNKRVVVFQTVPQAPTAGNNTTVIHKLPVITTTFTPKPNYITPERVNIPVIQNTQNILISPPSNLYKPSTTLQTTPVTFLVKQKSPRPQMPVLLPKGPLPQTQDLKTKKVPVTTNSGVTASMSKKDMLKGPVSEVSSQLEKNNQANSNEVDMKSGSADELVDNRLRKNEINIKSFARKIDGKDNAKNECIMCKKMFASKEAMAKHFSCCDLWKKADNEFISRKDGYDDIKCHYSKCDYVTPYKENYKRHIIETHTKHFEYYCCLCSKGFVNKYDKNVHNCRKKSSILNPMVDSDISNGYKYSDNNLSNADKSRTKNTINNEAENKPNSLENSLPQESNVKNASMEKDVCDEEKETIPTDRKSTDETSKLDENVVKNKKTGQVELNRKVQSNQIDLEMVSKLNFDQLDIGKSNYNCHYPSCTFQTALQFSFIRHCEIKHKLPKPFQCKHCGTAFVVGSSLEKHISKCNKDNYDSEETVLDNKITEKKRKQQSPHPCLKVELPERVRGCYHCAICTYKMKVPIRYKMHVWRHTLKDAKYHCDNCGIGYEVYRNIKFHESLCRSKLLKKTPSQHISENLESQVHVNGENIRSKRTTKENKDSGTDADPDTESFDINDVEWLNVWLDEHYVELFKNNETVIASFAGDEGLSTNLIPLDSSHDDSDFNSNKLPRKSRKRKYPYKN